MKLFSIHTLGCKVNQYESQQIRELLEKFDLRLAESTEKPDLVIVNTCCVTHTASAKSRQQIHKIQKHHPEAILVVCGCLPALNRSGTGPVITNASISPADFPKKHQTEQDDEILFVPKRDELAATLIQLVNTVETHDHASLPRPQSITPIKTENDVKIKSKKGFGKNRQMPGLSRFKGQTRAFLKVQDGCDGFCTYCIIPKTRPELSYKPVNDAVDEAKSLVNAGHKEIVITGICLGAYGRDVSLPNLVEKIAQIPHLERIRLSSIEPTDITDRLLEIFQKYPNIMPHIHLSLQSGSDAVLRKMCRKYKIDDVRKKIEQIRNLLDKPAITTDIIAGFPSETDEDFDNTVKLVKEIGFAKIHVFRFSPREGTPASRMKDTVDNNTINLRSKILRELDQQSGLNFRNQFIGKYETILIENMNGQISGRSERYFIVHLNTSEKADCKFQKNDIVKVKLLQNNKNGMEGEPAD